MKQLFFLILISFFSCYAFAQRVVVSADKNNIFYIGVDNPITVAAENSSCKDLVIKTNNGNIAGKGCQLIYRGKEVGRADIIVYKKTGNKLNEIGRNAFRVKRLPAPTFKIGPYGSSYPYSERKAKAVVLASQQYVRAELENFDFEYKCSIDSFSVNIFHLESGKRTTFFNVSNKISPQISDAFSELKNGDVIFFNKIFSTCPDKIQSELDSLILTVEN